MLAAEDFAAYRAADYQVIGAIHAGLGSNLILMDSFAGDVAQRRNILDVLIAALGAGIGIGPSVDTAGADGSLLIPMPKMGEGVCVIRHTVGNFGVRGNCKFAGAPFSALIINTAAGPSLIVRNASAVYIQMIGVEDTASEIAGSISGNCTALHSEVSAVINAAAYILGNVSGNFRILQSNALVILDTAAAVCRVARDFAVCNGQGSISADAAAKTAPAFGVSGCIIGDCAAADGNFGSFTVYRNTAAAAFYGMVTADGAVFHGKAASIIQEDTAAVTGGIVENLGITGHGKAAVLHVHTAAAAVSAGVGAVVLDHAAVHCERRTTGNGYAAAIYGAAALDGVTRNGAAFQREGAVLLDPYAAAGYAIAAGDLAGRIAALLIDGSRGVLYGQFASVGNSND